MKKTSSVLAFLLSLCLLLSACGKTETPAPAVEETPAAETAPVVEETPAVEEIPAAEEAPAAQEAPALESGVSEIKEYGNIQLSLPAATLHENGYDFGDVVTLCLDEMRWDMPFGTSYSDVDVGEAVLRESKGLLVVAYNRGDFATENGIAASEKDADGNISWTLSGDRALEDLHFTISMKEKEGYLNEYTLRALEKSNERSDFESDEVFANFRSVHTTGIAENLLYRSSSPVYNKDMRAACADDLFEATGIKSVVNLADGTEDIEAFFATEDFDSPYYKGLYESGAVLPLGLGIDFAARDFSEGVAATVRRLLDCEAPVAIHCNEGKDRAGFVCAVLEMFMGASYEEVEEDYMLSFINYYKLEKGTEQYEAVKKASLNNVFSVLTGLEESSDFTGLDLQLIAELYLRGIGLTEEECTRLQTVLSGK